MSKSNEVRFKLENGRIIMVVETLVWGDYIKLLEEDVTDKVMPVVDDYLDEHLGLTTKND